MSTNASPRGIARFDSATAQAHALALALNGSEVASLSGSPLLDRAMPLVNRLPRRAREWVYSIGGMSEGIAAGGARELDVAAIARWLAGLFPERRYPAAFIGSSNGALMHVAAAMGVPWLAQTFLCPVRQWAMDPDDPRRGLAAGRAVAAALSEAHPELSIHHMHDPNQDRLMLRMMSYFRLKLRRLPEAYRDFLARSLPRGATLYIDRCTLQWPVTRTGARSVFQFGAVGGATHDEYFRGGERVRHYFKRYRSKRLRWDPPEPDDSAPEAEWGFEPALAAELHALARERGWRVVEVSFADPEAMSFLAAEIYRDWYRALGIEPRRLVIDSFILMDPRATLRLRAIPFWSVFPVEPSLRNVERFLAQQPPFDEIDQMLFSHGTEGIGVAPLDDWRRIIGQARRRCSFLGVDERRYPRDFATFIRFQQALHRLAPRHEPPPPLAVERFDALLRERGPRFGITSQDRALDIAS
jgi:hypothetical protein